MTAAPSCVERVEAAIHAWHRQFWVSDTVTPWPDEEDGSLHDAVYTHDALDRGCATVDGTLFVFTAGRGDALTDVVVETWSGPPPRPLEAEGWERTTSFVLSAHAPLLRVLEPDTARIAAQLARPGWGPLEGRLHGRGFARAHRTGGGDVYLIRLWPTEARAEA